VRVVLNGVRLQLAPPPPPISTAASSATSLDAAPSPPVSTTGILNSDSSNESSSQREDSAQPSIYLLNLIILELHDIAVVDEVGTECIKYLI
jgi:hypothetical protein